MPVPVKKTLAISMIGTIGLAVAACAPEPPSIKIGVSCPLTGDQAKIGQDMLHGAELAVAEANASGGLLGLPVKIYALDDQHNPTQAVAAAHRFSSDPRVVAVVAHLNSACTLPASDIYAKAGVAEVTPCSTNMDITRRGLTSIFRMCAHDGTQGSAALRYAARKLHTRVVFILDDRSTYGQGIADEFEKEAKRLRIRIAGRDSLNQGEKDFSSLLTKIKTFAPQLIFFGGMYPEGSLLAKQSRELGLKTTLLGGDGLFDKTLIQLAGADAAEGVTATMVGVDMAKVPAAKTFVAAYEKQFGQIGPYSPYAYDATRVVLAAIKRAGTADRAKVIEEIRKTKGFKGVTGVTTFDPHGDTLNQTISVYTVEKGAWAFRGLASGKI